MKIIIITMNMIMIMTILRVVKTMFLKMHNIIVMMIMIMMLIMMAMMLFVMMTKMMLITMTILTTIMRECCIY